MKNLNLKTKKLSGNKKQYIIEIDELKFNDAIMLNYRHELLVMKKEMTKEYNEEIKKYYKENIDYIIGDADPVLTLESIINRIGEKWFLKFFLKSERLSKRFIGDIYESNERRFNRIKKKHPFLLQGTEDREQMVKILQSSIAENVGLIKSIPKKFHDDILGDVMRIVGVGGNQYELAQALSKRSNLTSKRINLIARDQTAKATALIDRQNAIDTGLTKAKWKKSIAGKTHRKDHAEANNKEFDISKGCLISGEYILPRMKVNCKCSYKLVIDF
jgi:hypothetical protein